MITFNIGAGIERFIFIKKLIEILYRYEKINNNFHYVFFDSPPNCKWNGGRLNKNSLQTQKDAEDIITFFNNNGFGFNFTFSNQYIDLDDKLGNYYLEKFHNSMNGVIISNDDFNNYVKQKYPLYKRIKSITDFYINHMENKQYLNHNIYINFFKQNGIPLSKLEILINNGCFKTCKFRKLHYESFCKYNYLNDTNNQVINHATNNICMFNYYNFNLNHQQTDINDLILTESEIQQLIDENIINFKISARSIKEEDLEFTMKKFLFPHLNIPNTAFRLQNFSCDVNNEYLYEQIGDITHGLKQLEYKFIKNYHNL